MKLKTHKNLALYSYIYIYIYIYIYGLHVYNEAPLVWDSLRLTQ